ncbi:HAD-IA family hydrolase [Thiocapsa sp.]|uniref:HAD-IA family hydrolase n=1 Tax=Thiocapsa sp. TaxID=2024551 RepID=UPI002BF32F57|nr:HAD-IA family hydrolase [Thiocapsa sp.]HSO83057.1 HAD-IA family hydrolase [Thiocapsa sp.]
MTFDLIVFDWDGTLMDSEARIVHCLQAAFGDLGLPPPAREAARDVIGLGLDEALLRLHPEADPQTLRDLATGYRRYFLEIDPTPSVLFAGARETLSQLADEGYRLAVATGKGRVGLDKALADTGLGALFNATRCADETFSKPNPQMLFELMDELGADASATLMIGDTEYDMQMALNARTKALAVSYGVHPVERLLPHAPLDCIHDIAALPAWLTGYGMR